MTPLTERLDLAVAAGVPMEDLEKAGFWKPESGSGSGEWRGSGVSRVRIARGETLVALTFTFERVVIGWLGWGSERLADPWFVGPASTFRAGVFKIGPLGRPVAVTTGNDISAAIEAALRAIGGGE